MRKYLAGKLLVTHALALLLMGACLFLSHWQWERAHYARQAVLSANPVPFESLSRARDFLPPSSVGQLTEVSGTWQTGSRVLLPNRPIDGRQLIRSGQSAVQNESGSWVADFLKLQDGTSVAVIRGWLRQGSNFPAATGLARITGVVQPAEDAPNEAEITASPLITTKFLLSNSQTDLRDGFIVQTGVSAGLVEVVPSRQAFTSDGLRTLNVFYTFNWIFFAFLILLIWFRIFREEVSAAT